MDKQEGLKEGGKELGSTRIISASEIIYNTGLH